MENLDFSGETHLSKRDKLTRNPTRLGGRITGAVFSHRFKEHPNCLIGAESDSLLNSCTSPIKNRIWCNSCGSDDRLTVISYHKSSLGEFNLNEEVEVLLPCGRGW